MLLFALLELCSFSSDHDSNLAVYTISQNEGVWTLKIEFAAKRLIRTLREKGVNQTVPEEEYSDAAIDLFKENIEILLNENQLLPLRSGNLELGNHVGEVTFTLEEFNPSWKEMECHIECFKGNTLQTNYVQVKMSGNEVFKDYLTERNSFHSKFIRNFNPD